MTITPDEAREQANQTLAALYANVTDWDTAVLNQAIDAIGGDGRPFSMNDVRNVLPDIAHGAAGLFFHSLIRRRNPVQLIVVGEEPSTAPSTHGKPIKVYKLAPNRLAAARAERRAA
ncbi:hypothetical protein [Streptomyces odontomachi]|uniref:hypothetical protein n=1 Tax=Streptomyces odontomachi TaxID=2944940 RepID=UPI00210C1A9D|nr:hypothetical protein [Streptomyces sp. ODS25]